MFSQSPVNQSKRSVVCRTVADDCDDLDLKLSRAWFKRKLLQSEGLLKEGSFERLRFEGKELKEANELMWESTLERAIQALGKTGVDIAREKKSG